MMSAAKGGLQAGDIILKYDNQPIDRSSDLPLLVADEAPGKSAPVEVWRSGHVKELSIATGRASDEKIASNDQGNAEHGRLGLAVRPLTPQERSENNGKGGLVVEQVSGAAERAGVQPGDVVLALNGTPVRSVQELKAQAAKSGKHVALLVQRNDRQLFVPIELG
jgi:serine protease Do